MSMQEMITVYTVSNAIEAEIIKNALEDEGIRCEIEGGHQAGEAGLIGIEIKLQVPEDQAEAARAFIQDHETSHSDNDDLDEAGAPEDGIQDLERREGIQEA
ncbi:MAG: DUF2007 domain-containing protein [Planctomycetota bacterium]|jgi:hypothetical protein